ncbi:MAG TPA: Ig-like domain-containing protein, partial [Verrucomicrobiae bacterium]|nr:Ig-like domain-containing protein [Verrucomicrobiae bacterium]
YTWRKVHGAGNVTFTPNGTAGGKDTTVLFDGTPGQYLFEVKMSDSRGFTEVYETVAVTLNESGGTLPANQAPTANPQSLAVGQGTPTPIVLTGTDPDSRPLTYAITAQPAYGQLTGVLPNVVYTSLADYTGSDSFTFTVTDDAGQVSAATVSITVDSGAAIEVAVYEPFAYPVGGLNGASGTSEVGFASPWTAPSQTTVAAASLDHGSLQPLGGSLSELGTGGSLGGSRMLSASALAGNGLLADGATLWFSAVIGPGADSWNNSIQFALANNQFNTNRTNIVDVGAQLGSGLGLSISRSGGGAVVAANFRDATEGNEIIYGSWNSDVGLPFSTTHQYRLIVGKIVWGAASDTIEIYQPSGSLFLPSTPVSTLTANVDQSTYDTITFARGNAVMLDEIRFGATYQSVLQGTVAMSPDNAAPQPDPMTFDVAATPAGPSSISMVAATAFDPTGVEYLFTCTAGGGHDSGWQDSPIYTDTGLTPGVQYTYTVKARDKSPARNETAFSAPSSATIPIQATVPDLTGMPQDAAESAIAGAGLAVGTVTGVYSDSAPPGSVISQSP